MHRIKLAAAAALVTGGLGLVPLASAADAVAFTTVPKVYSEVAACTAAGAHDMTVTSERMYMSNHVTWDSVAIDATRESWFRVDLISGGREVRHWSGIRNGRVRGAQVTIDGPASIGSKLYVSAYFANGATCSVTETS